MIAIREVYDWEEARRLMTASTAVVVGRDMHCYRFGKRRRGQRRSIHLGWCAIVLSFAIAIACDLQHYIHQQHDQELKFFRPLLPGRSSPPKAAANTPFSIINSSRKSQSVPLLQHAVGHTKPTSPGDQLQMSSHRWWHSSFYWMQFIVPRGELLLDFDSQFQLILSTISQLFSFQLLPRKHAAFSVYCLAEDAEWSRKESRRELNHHQPALFYSGPPSQDIVTTFSNDLHASSSTSDGEKDAVLVTQRRARTVPNDTEIIISVTANRGYNTVTEDSTSLSHQRRLAATAEGEASSNHAGVDPPRKLTGFFTRLFGACSGCGPGIPVAPKDVVGAQPNDGGLPPGHRLDELIEEGSRTTGRQNVQQDAGGSTPLVEGNRGGGGAATSFAHDHQLLRQHPEKEEGTLMLVRKYQQEAKEGSDSGWSPLSEGIKFPGVLETPYGKVEFGVRQQQPAVHRRGSRGRATITFSLRLPNAPFEFPLQFSHSRLEPTPSSSSSSQQQRTSATTAAALKSTYIQPHLDGVWVEFHPLLSAEYPLIRYSKSAPWVPLRLKPPPSFGRLNSNGGFLLGSFPQAEVGVPLPPPDRSPPQSRETFPYTNLQAKDGSSLLHRQHIRHENKGAGDFVTNQRKGEDSYYQDGTSSSNLHWVPFADIPKGRIPANAQEVVSSGFKLLNGESHFVIGDGSIMTVKYHHRDDDVAQTHHPMAVLVLRSPTMDNSHAFNMEIYRVDDEDAPNNEDSQQQAPSDRDSSSFSTPGRGEIDDGQHNNIKRKEDVFRTPERESRSAAERSSLPGSSAAAAAAHHAPLSKNYYFIEVESPVARDDTPIGTLGSGRSKAIGLALVRINLFPLDSAFPVLLSIRGDGARYQLRLVGAGPHLESGGFGGVPFGLRDSNGIFVQRLWSREEWLTLHMPKQTQKDFMFSEELDRMNSNERLRPLSEVLPLLLP